jgi:glycine/D-amino acid oxidase-like deaminating enzyme
MHVRACSNWLVAVSAMEKKLDMDGSAAPGVVVLGAGIHGASVAYYLSTRFNIQSTIVERSSVGAAASGKAGGFLARNWGSGSTSQLHEVSFDMHASLARDLEISSYRAIATLSVDGSRKGQTDANWLDKKAKSKPMDSATAQVTPLELTQKLIDTAVRRGCRLVLGTVTGVRLIGDGKAIQAVLVDGHEEPILASKLVVCLGPWSGVFCEDHFGVEVPMEGVKSTSLVFSAAEAVKQEPFACFCEEDRNGCHLELYPRANGEVYICGCGGSDNVSGDRLRPGGDCEKPELIHADPKRVAAACASFRDMSTLGERAPDITQACMRPCTPDGLPVMGEIPGVDGAFVSAGHNCWGILWAPASGLAMAELVATGKSSTIDLTAFRVNRFTRGNSRRGKKKGEAEVGEQW